MKKIGIDARLYSQTGVGVYIRNLLYYLQKLPLTDCMVTVYGMEDEISRIPLTHKQFAKKGLPYRWHSIGEQVGFWRFLEGERLDLMHFTYFSYPVMYRKPFVATVHDLTPLLFKTGRASTQNILLYQLKYQFFKHILATQIKNACHIITPTKAVSDQIKKYYGVLDKISAIYEGVDVEIMQTPENRGVKNYIQDPYFLYVGNFYPHKNIERLVKAFSTLTTNTQLVLAGPSDYFAGRIRALVEKYNAGKNIRFYNSSSRADLVYLYKHAQALINPSLSEGFGLPIVEAAYFNLPIIASNIEVFQEILGENYLAFDPTSEADIAEKIQQFLERSPEFSYRDILKNLSFEKMAQETFQIYEKC